MRPLDLETHFGLLALNGRFVSVGTPPEPPLVRGLVDRGIRETQEMLDFCAEHGVVPDVEIVGADEVNEAWARVLDSDVRYRFVIDIDTVRS